ncbi:MAG: signal recognition particle receptor subunit alpha [Deltaproteobacteria bacterium]|nr:signal recognition particle receptor subunit alpha [Deltaproteobacteria bacterium]MCX7952123.1 signal recognition particle receptor subunit alpha [Deltaproteobacteria bacterium]
MFLNLTKNIVESFKKAFSRGVISNETLANFAQNIKTALLDADCSIEVANHVANKILEKGRAAKISAKINPENELLKITFVTIRDILGGVEPVFYPKGKPPQVVLFVGLQGSGKTTTVAKYAHTMKKKFKKDCVVTTVDMYRPGAIEQLAELCINAKVRFFNPEGTTPVEKTKNAVRFAELNGSELLIIDTQGRTELNEELMRELRILKEALNGCFTILVVDSMIGQSAVSLAQSFKEQIGIDGTIFTKFDSDTKGGSVLSIRWLTGAPVIFLGVGEKIDDLEPFIPSRMASRILGQGDLETLFEKTEEVVDQKKASAQFEKIKKGEFTFLDFLEQLENVSRLGSFSKFLGLIPGLGSLSSMVRDEDVTKKLKAIKAIIQSMTPEERINEKILNESRIKRIAKGSGVPFEEVRLVLKQFTQLKQMLPQVLKLGPQGILGKLTQMRKF